MSNKQVVRSSCLFARGGMGGTGDWCQVTAVRQITSYCYMDILRDMAREFRETTRNIVTCLYLV